MWTICQDSSISLFFFSKFDCGSYITAVLKAYYLIYTQKLHLSGFRRLYRVPGIKPRMTECKANTLLYVLSAQTASFFSNLYINNLTWGSSFM